MKRRGSSVLALVLALTGVLAMAGLAAATQTSGSLRTVERVHARRLRDRAVDAAVEEASAALEAGLADVPPGAAGQGRDLGLLVRWPGRTTSLESEYIYSPALASARLAPAGVEFPEPIRMISSPWETAWGTGKDAHVLERGVLTFSITVSAHDGRAQLRTRVTVRRQLAVARVGGRLRVVVLPASLGREEVEL